MELLDAHPSPEGVMLAPARPCIQCGYDLLGLRVDGLCPECGTPVERSLRGDLFRYCSEEYVRKLHVGAYLVELVGFLWIPLGIALAIVGMIAKGLLGRGSALGVLAGGLIPGSLVAAFAIGCWLLTTRDPYRKELTDVGARRITRIATMVAAAPAVLLPFIGAVKVSIVVGGSGARLLILQIIEAFSLVLWIAAGVSVVVAYFTLLAYLRAIAPRFPDEQVGSVAKMLMILPVWVLGAVLVFLLCRVVTGSDVFWLLQGFFLLVSGAGLAIGWLWLVDHVRSGFKRARWMMEREVKPAMSAGQELR